jgi:hypothetical protein
MRATGAALAGADASGLAGSLLEQPLIRIPKIAMSPIRAFAFCILFMMIFLLLGFYLPETF